MSPNLGLEDRLFRLILAGALFSLGLVLENHGRLIGMLGVWPFVGAITGWSPFYALCRIRTVESPDAKVSRRRKPRHLAGRTGAP